jgi:PTH1 family peptidyl-tRNA hydrolase
LSCNRGPGGHNGVKDIIRAIGSDFIRFRLGVGMKKDSRMDLADHVLSRLTIQEAQLFTEKTDFFLCTLREVLDKGCAYAMNSVNQTT